jgi:putative ABC transport system permease protein
LLRRSPGFTAVAGLSLALGIGANTAIFSVVNAVLLSPLPYQNADRLVMLWENDTQEGNDRNPVAPANFVDWRKQNEVCEQLAYFTQPQGLNLTGSGEPERILGIGVSANLFPLLGIQPMLGRHFLPIDGKTNSGLEVILSHGLWQRRFGTDPAVIGKPMVLDGISFTIVAVMPPQLQLPEEAELWWQTLNGELATVRGQHFLRVIGRLKPGMTRQQAQANFTTIARQLEQQYPETNKGYGVNLLSLKDQLVGRIERALLILLGAVGFVLLIACANVANLLLVRAAARQKEVAIRAALGANRLRLMRHLLTESLLLALAGGALGLLLAVWGVDLIVALGAANIPRAENISLDLRVLSFALLLTLLAGISFGLAPAWHASQIDVHTVLKEGDRSGNGSLGRQRMRGLLVISEIALSLVLLVGAGLLLKSFWRLQAVELGFDPGKVLTMQFSLPGIRYGEREQMAAFYRQLTERVAALPGVRAVGAISRLPLAGDRSTSGLTIEGRPARAGEQLEVHYRVITPGYFRAVGIPLRAGRELTERDTESAPAVAIVNESMAGRYWPGGDATGKRIKLGPNRNGPWVSIVGVVGDARNFGLAVAPQPEVYISYLQGAQERMRLVVRTAAEPLSLVPALREAVRALDPELPFSQVTTMEQLLAKSVAERRLNLRLLSIFAVVAVALAAVGIYGVMSYTVAQRTREIGIRLALGALPADVLTLVIRQGMILAVMGVVIGLAGAFALTRLMSNLLFGVSATDPATFALIAVLLAGVALLACYLPARRATRVDPLVALRCE